MERLWLPPQVCSLALPWGHWSWREPAAMWRSSPTGRLRTTPRVSEEADLHTSAAAEPADEPAALDSNTAGTSHETSSQKHPAKPHPGSRPENLRDNHVCCFAVLRFGGDWLRSNRWPVRADPESSHGHLERRSVGFPDPTVCSCSPFPLPAESICRVFVALDSLLRKDERLLPPSTPLQHSYCQTLPF